MPFVISYRFRFPNILRELVFTAISGGYALVRGFIYLYSAPVYLRMGASSVTTIPLALVGGGIKLAGSFAELSTGLFLADGTILKGVAVD